MSKYTKEQLEPLVAQSTSLIGVVRQLGITSYGGGTQAYIKKIISGYGLSTSHFLGKGSNRGASHKGGNQTRPASDILVLLEVGGCEKAFRLRRALLEIGRKNECECCGQKPEWNGKPLILQVDHKNGLKHDNRPDNLRLICPNCHTQTNNFCSKNKAHAQVA